MVWHRGGTPWKINMETKNPPNWKGKSSSKKTSTSFFQVTFWFPKWRSLSPWRGHLKPPKRSRTEEPGIFWFPRFPWFFFLETASCWPENWVLQVTQPSGDVKFGILAACKAGWVWTVGVAGVDRNTFIRASCSDRSRRLVTPNDGNY